MTFDEIEKANSKHLDEFKKWLNSKGLVLKTINNHITNVDFYINDFVNGYFEEDVQQGCYKISQFLGDWFIRKATWSSCTNIKANAASIKKFYACMLEIGVVTQKDFDVLCETIKDTMPAWLDDMRKYESDSEICDDF